MTKIINEIIRSKIKRKFGVDVDLRDRTTSCIVRQLMQYHEVDTSSPTLNLREAARYVGTVSHETIRSYILGPNPIFQTDQKGKIYSCQLDVLKEVTKIKRAVNKQLYAMVDKV